MHERRVEIARIPHVGDWRWLRIRDYRHRLSLAVVFCIAPGMAATAAVATLIDLTTFRAPPFPDAERFVRIWNSEAGSEQRDTLAYRDFADLRERLAALDALEGAARARLIWHRQGDIGRRVEGEAITADYFALLDVQPYIGRMISREEHARGDAVLLLSYDTWGREFNFDEDILGQPLRTAPMVGQRKVILRGLRVATAGLFVGGIASLGFARVLQGMLHGVGSFDAVAFAAAAGLLGISALVACWLPARRAARGEPMQALRQE